MPQQNADGTPALKLNRQCTQTDLGRLPASVIKVSRKSVPVPVAGPICPLVPAMTPKAVGGPLPVNTVPIRLPEVLWFVSRSWVKLSPSPPRAFALSALVALSALFACLAEGTSPRVSSKMSAPVSESLATLLPLTAEFLIFTFVTAFLWSFVAVTAPFSRSLVPIVEAAYPTPPIETNSAISATIIDGDGRNLLLLMKVSPPVTGAGRSPALRSSTPSSPVLRRRSRVGVGAARIRWPPCG